MCGIAGFWGDGDQSVIDQMTDMLAHRGPDGRGTWHSPKHQVRLGHRRLSIIDLQDGAQPMESADGRLVITFNGEIYNHRELRQKLAAAGHVFQTNHSDTEVLLHAYREWGPAMLTHLNGMWAFAILDFDHRKLFLSRDRFGKKPLFYSQRPNYFAFASELTALKQYPAVNAHLAISPIALQKYFAYGYIPAPHSIFQGIQKLPAGHSLTLSLENGSVALQKYWDFVVDPFENIPADAENQWSEELIRLLDQAVERRLMSDVPLGVFLSGGIDSSCIAALATRHSSVPVKTFSIGFEDPSFDESDHALAAAKYIGSDHCNETLSLEKSIDLLPDIVGRLDEPMGDSSLLPTYLVSRIARKHVTVALGGDGGDELFAGYDPFLALSKASLYQKFTPKPVHKAIRLLASKMPVSHANMSLEFKIKRTLRGLTFPPELWCPIWMSPLSPDEIKDILPDTPAHPEELYSEAIDAWDSCPQDNLADKTMQFFIKLYLQDDILAKVDRASMMHGLEVRAPFLDIDFVNFVRRVPWQFKLRGNTTKFLLKKAASSLLPDTITLRKKKGFGIPVGRWFREQLLPFNTDAAPPYAALDETVARSYYASHLAGQSDQRLFLWNYWLLTNMNLH